MVFVLYEQMTDMDEAMAKAVDIGEDDVSSSVLMLGCFFQSYYFHALIFSGVS